MDDYNPSTDEQGDWNGRRKHLSAQLIARRSLKFWPTSFARFSWTV
jgi:hypothetical protein